MRKVLLVLILIASRVHGQERIFGQDLLAAQHPSFQTTKALLYIPANSALGTLDFTFGTSLSPIIDLLSSGKFNFYRVHIINGPCLANRNCGPYDPIKDYTVESFEAAVLKKDPVIIKFLTDRVKLYCPLRLRFPKVEIRISPMLEHRLGKQAFRILADTTLAACPGVGLVNNAMNGDGEKYKRAWQESHDGYKKPRTLVSFDGFDATDADIAAWRSRTRNGKVSFVWSRVYNCRNNGPFVDPRNRTSCPKERDFDLLAHITDDRGVAPSPKFVCKFEAFKSPYIWKPFAEDTGSTDPRSNLPVALVPLDNRDVELVGQLGKSIGSLKYYGAYQKGLNRYYSGTSIKLSGYQIEKKIDILNGSPWTWLKQGGRCIGPFVPGRRSGSYR